MKSMSIDKTKSYLIRDYVSLSDSETTKAMIDKVMADNFWLDVEKKIIQSLIHGKKMTGWDITYRNIQGNNLKFCITKI